QLLLQPAILHDESKLAQPRVVSAELEASGAIVAVDLHRFDARNALRRQPRPNVQRFEEGSRPRTDSVDAGVPGIVPGDGLQELRLDQRDLQTPAPHGKCEAQPN